MLLIIILASSDSCWDPQLPPTWREVPDGQKDTVLSTLHSCQLGVSSHLCLPVLQSWLSPGTGLGQLPLCLRTGDCFLRSYPEAGQACS